MDEGKFSVASKDGVVEYGNLDELSLLSILFYSHLPLVLKLLLLFLCIFVFRAHST